MARNWPSTSSQTRLPSARQSRPARCATASSTGCTSVGDSLITPQDLGGRRLALQRHLRLVEQSHVLDGDDGLVAERLGQRDFLVAECAGRVLPNVSRPMHSPPRRSGRYRPALTPSVLWTFRSCSGRSMVDQSGRCSNRLLHDDARRKVGGRIDGHRAKAGLRLEAVRRGQAATEKVLPSVRITKAESHPSSRTAVTTIASNTGCTSVGELLITRRMSAVAVWWPSASCVSLNSRTFCSATPTLAAIVDSRRSSLASYAPSVCVLWTLITPRQVSPTLIGTPRYESAGRPTTFAPSLCDLPVRLAC